MPTVIKGTITDKDLRFADYLQTRLNSIPQNTVEVAVICKELGLGPEIPESGRFYDKMNPEINTILLSAQNIMQVVREMQIELISGWYSEDFASETKAILENFRSIAIEAAEGVEVLKNVLRSWEMDYKADILTEAKKRNG
jgi:hypothetical protein